MNGSIKTIVVDDHAIVREGIKTLLELQDGIDVVAEAASGMECLNMLEEACPDVILMDLKMPGIDGIEATRLVKERNPLVKVVLLTNYDDDEYVLESIRAHADGYVLKNVNKGDLPKIIRGVMEDRAFIDPAVTQKLFNSIRQSGSTEEETLSRPLLSQRELQILTYVVEGRTNKEIAQTINLSLDTVKSHLKNIYQKLNVHNRAQAARVVLKEQLIHLSR
jgi:DNA-binding NarL/FixJ family response regulator